MRIAFITGCLEPGRDGVGDYTRTLAAECQRRGHEVALVSLAESAPPSSDESKNWPILRLTTAQSRSDGGRAVREWLDAFAPDWSSLQFVPYSFHPRGFFAGAIPMLARILEAAPRRHIFFHEIWIGAEVDARWKARVTGWWQRRAVGRLLQQLAPAQAHTSIEYNRAGLGAQLRQPAALLTMFGAVPVPPSLGRRELPGIDSAALVCGMFGSLHPNWEPEPFLEDFAAMAARQRRPAVLATAGAMRSGVEFFERIAAKWRGRVACVALGERSPAELAGIFARFDFAVTSVPWTMIGKSSSAAALREHGLRVVVTKRGAAPRFAKGTFDDAGSDEGFIPYFRDRANLARALEKTPPRPGIDAIAARFLADLNTTS